jgi:DNA-directed RNA polymerase specialized sigma24 family protein
MDKNGSTAFWNAVKSGDRNAWDSVLPELLPEILKKIAAKLGSPAKKQMSEDYVISAVGTLLRRLKEDEKARRNYSISSREDLAALIFRFAWNKARTGLRKRNVQALSDDKSPEELNNIALIDFRDAVDSACDKLVTDPCREIIRLLLDGGDDKKSVAKNHGVSVRTVNRCIERFRDNLDKIRNDDDPPN